MANDIRDRLRDYWTSAEQFLTFFYNKTLKRDQFIHILNFIDNNAETGRQDNYDRLWKIRIIFVSLNDSYE
jgi:hypothetical protein